MMTERQISICVLIFFAIIFAISGYFISGIWNECRETNSFVYCWKVFSK